MTKRAELSWTYHARAAAFMTAAVLSFAIGDTLTKLVTADIDIVPVLFIRASIGLLIVVFAAYISGITIDRSVLYDSLLVARAFLFVVTVGLFATGLKLNSFTGFYLTFFIFLPIFALGFDWIFLQKYPSFSSLLPTSLMLVGVFIVHYGNLTDILRPSAIISIVTALSYASYLGFSNYINEKRKYNSLVQVVPNFTYGGAIFLILSLLPPDSRSELLGIFNKLQTFIYIAIAGLFSAVGLLFINRATSYDTSGRVAPYEYTIIVYAVFIDNFLFGVEVTRQLIAGAICVAVGAIWLSIVQQKAEAAVS